MRAAVVSAGTAACTSAMAAGAGVLTRPCCLGPALLSLFGGSAASLGHVFTNHQTAFAVLSGALLTYSVWVNIRVQTQGWNRWLAALATVGSFILVARSFWF
ncbi:MAG: hypothetical protein ABI039_10935 [Vicinamibacterales bacterium]